MGAISHSKGKFLCFRHLHAMRSALGKIWGLWAKIWFFLTLNLSNTSCSASTKRLVPTPNLLLVHLAKSHFCFTDFQKFPWIPTLYILVRLSFPRQSFHYRGWNQAMLACYLILAESTFFDIQYYFSQLAGCWEDLLTRQYPQTLNS